MPTLAKCDDPRKAAPVRECPECGDYGLIVNAEGQTIRCPRCSRWTDAQRAEMVRRACIPPRFARASLNNFDVPKGDALRKSILELARSYAYTFSGKEERGLLLRGGTGTGKTHIATGILLDVIAKGHKGLYVNVSDLMARLIRTMDAGASETEEDIFRQVTGVDLLVLDDLGAEPARDWVRDRIYLIVNTLYDNLKPVIVTTNCSNEELASRNGERVVSRLQEMCAAIRFPEGDKRADHEE